MTDSPSTSSNSHARQRPRRRRWLLGGFAALLVALLSLVALGFWLYPKLLTRYGIVEIEVQGISLAQNRLSLARLVLAHETTSGQRLRLVADEVRLSWHWPAAGWRPVPEVLEVGGLQVQGWKGELEVDHRPWWRDLLSDPQAWRWTDWLPRILRLYAAELELPCAAGRCQMKGSGEYERQGEDARLDLRLAHGEHWLELESQLGIRPGLLQVDVQARFDDAPLFHLQSQLGAQDVDHLDWSGRIQLARIPPQAAWQDWLGEWLPAVKEMPRIAADLHQPLDRAALQGHWQIALPAASLATPTARIAPSGTLTLDASLPAATPIPWIGALGGELSLAVTLLEGGVEAYRVQGDLQAPGLPWLSTAAPRGFDPGPVRLQLTGSGQWQGERPVGLPLDLRLTSAGPLQANAKGQVLVRLQAPFGIDLIQSDLQLTSQRLELGTDIHLEQAAARLFINGQVGADGYRFQLTPASWITANRLVHPEVTLEQARATPDALRVYGDQGHPHWQGRFQLQTPRLLQTQLKPQGWSWQSTLDYHDGRVAMAGSLRAAAGLVLNHDLTRPPGGPLLLRWHTDELVVLADNPLPQTFVDWPAKAELARGRISARGEWRLPDDGEGSTEISIQLRDLVGLYDRTWIEGLSGQLQVERAGDYLQVASEGLTIMELNPGIAAGPVQVAGSYLAPIADFADGMLDIDRAEARVLGGRVWLEPVHLNLAQDRLRLPLLIRELDLAAILALYKSDELRGEGTLDGVLPLMVSPHGVAVVEGRVQARPPGGLLRYQPERGKALAQSDARMDLVMRVLENFRYSVLASDIGFSETGRLTLGVMISGRNPELPQSPPVNLNINLEEHLPMLLASLQLSDNVSDKIKQRVSEALKQRSRNNE